MRYAVAWVCGCIIATGAIAQENAPVSEDTLAANIAQLSEELRQLEDAIRRVRESLETLETSETVQEEEQSAPPPAASDDEDASPVIQLTPSSPSEEATEPEPAETPQASSSQIVYEPAARLLREGREAIAALNFYDATRLFREFLSKYPQHSEALNAYYWLGETLYEQGQYQDAIEAFAEVLEDEQHPRRTVAQLKIGYAWFELDNFEAARQMLTRVRDKDPNSNLGRLAQLRLERIDRQTDAE